ncbi:uncharacterized protein LOC127701418 isoform X4 [Mytilus californianus]|uniref:uncharacterized protein LOC127701418 isoform X4 n=1 Tax=Mytilus californianus TaxID=6549 RepID=UPI0022485B80|nr:uncharacterized protein LOC127701418 isoform X4 [Mytilus californianus]
MDPMDKTSEGGKTALHLAAENIIFGLEITQWLVDEKGMDPMDKTLQESKTALHLAAEIGNLELTQWLIKEKGMDPMVKTSKEGKTALHLAAENGGLEVTQWLVEEKGMDPMVKTSQGKTPYDLAAEDSDDECEDVVEYLQTFMPKEVTPGTSQQKYARPAVRGLQDNIKTISDKQFKNLLKSGTYNCFWNRIFLTGRFAVGKTTLAKILVGDEAPEQRQSTDGIWIYLGRAGMDIKERSWIFLENGTILNATIQSFLRSREMTHRDAEKHSHNIPTAPTVFSKTFKSRIPIPMKGHIFNTQVQSSSYTGAVKGGDYNPREKDKASKSKALDRIFPSRIPIPRKGTKISDIKKPDGGRGKIKETLITESLTDRKISDEEIIKLVRSECNKGTYEMVVVPIDLWDFGGQKIYHMTHQLFISSRGVFILIFNGGEKIQQEDGAYLVHWVNSVLTYCKTLNEFEEFPKILFVATHKDQVKGDIEEQRHYLENSIEILFQNHGGIKHLQYRPLIFVDARNKEDKEIDVLKKQLVEVALNHPRCGELMPTKFVPLELQLAKKGEDTHKIITIDELKDMNKLNENMALDNDELKLFLKVNHALGKLIYFDEAFLRDKVIIDPVFLVDVLRSIVTEEQFWPQHLLPTFKALKDSGKLQKQDLYEIWKQECFQTIIEHKEYMVEMLVHLDIICRQKDDTNGSDFFLIPCMISTKREDNLDIPFDRSIHLAYTFRDEIVPPAILYKFIATFVTIWKLQISKNASLMLFTDSADVSIDKEHDMRFDLQKNKLIITLSHNTSRTSIVSTIASTAQECLTHAITQISNFYFSVTEDSACTLDLPFTIQIGIVCDGNLCFFDHKFSSMDEWICPDHIRKHKTYIVSRWFADKLPAKDDRCSDNCLGLDKAWLDSLPDDKHLGRLAAELTIEETLKMYMHLKERKPSQSWKNIESYSRGDFDIKINALHDWKKSTKHATFRKLQESLKEEELNIHILCQILRDVQTDVDLPKDKLNLKPSSSDVKLLPNHIGRETFQLGIELGLSVVKMHQIQSNHVTNLRGQTEDVLNKWRKTEKAAYEVLAKTLYRLDLCSVLSYFSYDVGVKEQLEDIIRNNESRIKRKIETNQILDHMMTHLVISVDDRRRIEQHAGQDDRNKALLEIILERIEVTYLVFLDALQNSGYTNLADQLKCEIQDLSQIATLATTENEGISNVAVHVFVVQLQKNYSNIINNVMYETIEDHLMASDVLTIEDNQMVKSGSTQEQKNRELMDKLLRRGEKEFTEFLTALRVDNAELADQIEKTEVTSRNISTIQSCYKQSEGI